MKRGVVAATPLATPLAWLVALVVALAASAYAYTYESEIDPAAFEKWQVVAAEPGPLGVAVTFRNPDPRGEIGAAVCLIRSDGTLLAYCYLKDGKLRYFALHPGRDRYVFVELPADAERVLTEHLERVSPWTPSRT